MRKDPLLSICIPTFNRKSFLLNTLNKVAHFKDIDEVELVIADDFSTDGTDQEIQTFIKTHPEINLVYKRFSKRHYFDSMIVSIIKLAHGKFCWFISDDDYPFQETINKIKKINAKHPNISLIHVNYTRFDNILQKITAKRMVGSITRDILFNTADGFFFKPIRDSYFDYLGTNIITMSTDIVNRRMWTKSCNKVKKYIGHNFIHVFVIVTMIKEHPQIYYIGKPSVQYLSNNHRIWPNDIWKDFNQTLLKYMESIGYLKSNVNQMRYAQSKFEKREEVMKNRFTRLIYVLSKPLYVRLQYLKSKYVRN